jgi:hypothetical protein
MYLSLVEKFFLVSTQRRVSVRPTVFDALQKYANKNQSIVKRTTEIKKEIGA